MSDADTIILSDGTRIPAHGHVIGLGPDGVLYEGYDGLLPLGLTPAQKVEIAATMIDRWTKVIRDEGYDRPALLFPCPFCGGDAEVGQYSFTDTRWRVACNGPVWSCNGENGAHDTREDAIEAWNRRVPEPKP